jgi:hypothetical protein
MTTAATKIRRITPGEVLAAYARHPEVRPVREKLFERESAAAPVEAACLLGILALDAGCDFLERRYPTNAAAEGLGLGESYAYGLVAGFNADDLPVLWPVGCDRRLARLGHADGAAVAAAVFAAAAAPQPEGNTR